jgi:hypothetical protein
LETLTGCFGIFDKNSQMMEEIKIKVDPVIAKAYRTSSIEEQEKVTRILNEIIGYVLDKGKCNPFLLPGKY